MNEKNCMRAIVVLLFVIAVSLVFIGLKLHREPTFGELNSIKKIEDAEKRKAAFDDFLYRLPMSKVHSVMGTVDVNVENMVDVNVVN